MKLRNTLFAIAVLTLALPLLANAGIYKWKDKDGTIRYTDTPPPSNVKQEALSEKKIKASKPAQVANAGEPAGKGASQKEQAGKAQPAEADKNNKKEKEAQAKLKEENCRAAKANLASYQQGGRVYKMSEKGEREYLDAAGLKAGAEKSQKEVAEYCNG